MKSLLFLIAFSSSAFAAKDAGNYLGKYMFTHSHKPGVKEYDDVFSNCFKITGKVIEALKSYDLCDGNVVKQDPLRKAIGHCVRKKDDATAYIFETLEDCKPAMADAADGASS